MARTIAHGAGIRLLTPAALGPILDHEGLGVSLYLPTLPGRGSQEDHLHLKNLLADARAQLRDEGAEERLVRELIERVETVALDALEDGAPRGLAWFAGEDGDLHALSLPPAFAPEAFAGSGYRIRPLLPLLAGDGRFHLLCLSMDGVRLYEGSRHDLRPLALPGAPPPLAEALPEDTSEHQLRFSSVVPSTGKGNFHSNRGFDWDQKLLERIREYFRLVEHALHDVLDGDRTPLVLAGVEYLHPLFRDVARRPAILAAGIHGSPGQWSDDELHAAAWPLVAPLFARGVADARDRFGRLARLGRTAVLLSDVLAAAEEGRIATLFIPRVGACWGRRDDGDGVEIHGERGIGDVDLHDLAARRTLLAGGEVYAVPTEDIPDGEACAAILRY